MSSMTSSSTIEAHEFVESRTMPNTCIRFLTNPKTGVGSFCCRPSTDAIHPPAEQRIEIDDYVDENGERI